MPMYSSNFLITKLSYHLNSLSSSVQFNHSIMSDSLQLHELQHARPPCPSPVPGVCSDSCPLSWWCHPNISSSVIHFSRLWSFPAKGSFQMSQALRIRWPKYWNFSFSINPSNEYSGLISFRIDWFDLLAIQGPLNSLLQHHRPVRDANLTFYWLWHWHGRQSGFMWPSLSAHFAF